MKLGDVLATAIANTFRSKLRTTLTVIAIFIGAFTLTLTSAVGTGISDYIRTQVASIGASDTMTVTKTAEASSAAGSGPKRYDPDAAQSASPGGPGGGGPGATALTDKDVTAIEGVAGITSVTKNETVSPSWISHADAGRWQLSLSSIPQTKADLAAGAQLDDSASAQQILLPTSYLHDLGLGSSRDAVGQTVTIGIRDYAGMMQTATATVVGVQNATLFGSSAAANTALRSELIGLQRTGTPSTIAPSYGSVTANYDPHATPPQIDQIKQRLKDAGYTGQTIDDQLGSVLTVINGIVGVLDAFAVITLIAAGFGIVNTLLMSVQERTREIGLMKAMGMRSGRVFALFSAEAVFIGFLGSAIGAVVAIVLGTLLSDGLSRGLLSNLPGLHILQFAPSSIATIVIVVMAISFLAGTLPARRAARQNPIDALRYE